MDRQWREVVAVKSFYDVGVEAAEPGQHAVEIGAGSNLDEITAGNVGAAQDGAVCRGRGT